MTNREKFIEVFGYVPEDLRGFFLCPKECPKEYDNVPFCKGCPYLDFDNAEYKEPEGGDQ